MEKEKNGKLWELLEEYADIRNELEDNRRSFGLMYADIEIAMEDSRGEMEMLQEHLDKCSGKLKRYRGGARSRACFKGLPELPFQQ